MEIQTSAQRPHLARALAAPATRFRSLIRLAAVALAAFTVLLALTTGASPANAATTNAPKRLMTASGVSDPSLYASLGSVTLYTTPWYNGGGSCTSSRQAPAGTAPPMSCC